MTQGPNGNRTETTRYHCIYRRALSPDSKCGTDRIFGYFCILIKSVIKIILLIKYSLLSIDIFWRSELFLCRQGFKSKLGFENKGDKLRQSSHVVKHDVSGHLDLNKLNILQH